MKLLAQLAQGQVKSLALVMLLSMASAALTIAVIAFIQHKFLGESVSISGTILPFSLLLIALLATATVAQMALHKLGHQFVYNKRCQLIKQLINTDIEQVETIGSARVLASLNTDIRNITVAFVHLPELMYGLILSVIAMSYLAYLSISLFAVSLLMLSLTGVIGFWLITRITYHIKQVREYDDRLYQDYQSFIDGRKELSLNPGRAKRYFTDTFSKNAAIYRDQVVQADILNGFAANMANTIVLALIGLNYYLALGLGWSSFQVASSFALIILFMRTPLMTAVGALPTLVAATVSMTKLTSLSLSEKETFANQALDTTQGDSSKISPIAPFKELHLQQVTYQYRLESDSDDKAFCVGPIDLTIKRGELLFIIGGNGSGKSTFANLLTGLYRPHSGSFLLDDKPIPLDQWHVYRRNFSSVFSDFHLFHKITDGDGQDVENTEIDEWMERLEMAHKVSHENGLLSGVRYSQGQRKRLALLMAIMEKRGCILLDEWAADQDPRFRKLFYHDLLPLLKARGVTIIAITHDDKYFDMADRVLKMDNGQLTELNTENHAQINDAISNVAV